MNADERAAVHELRQPASIRLRCANIARAIDAGASSWFRVVPAALPAVVDHVANETRRNYPDLRVPAHSRWRHFEAGGIDRAATLERLLQPLSLAERRRSAVDLAVVSVLLDAGAGADWHWRDRDGRIYQRSEGLGVASFEAFVSGAFSSRPEHALQVDGPALAALSPARLAQWLQSSAERPLLGLESRCQLLRRLGVLLIADRERFGLDARPGHLIDTLIATDPAPQGDGDRIDAAAILTRLLDALAPIWSTPSRIGDHALGDCWRHPFAGGSGLSAGWVPFHKLSQWLCYSIDDALRRLGVGVVGESALTALPEYRNGGLLIDAGLLQPTPRLQAEPAMTVDHEAIIEWRALTVDWIDRLHPLVTAALGLSTAALPLAALLQGGTWSAGRRLAEGRHGAPPLPLLTDGTVF